MASKETNLSFLGMNIYGFSLQMLQFCLCEVSSSITRGVTNIYRDTQILSEGYSAPLKSACDLVVFSRLQASSLVHLEL